MTAQWNTPHIYIYIYLKNNQITKNHGLKYAYIRQKYGVKISRYNSYFFIYIYTKRPLRVQKQQKYFHDNTTEVDYDIMRHASIN